MIQRLDGKHESGKPCLMLIAYTGLSTPLSSPHSLMHVLGHDFVPWLMLSMRERDTHIDDGDAREEKKTGHATEDAKHDACEVNERKGEREKHLVTSVLFLPLLEQTSLPSSSSCLHILMINEIPSGFKIESKNREGGSEKLL